MKKQGLLYIAVILTAISCARQGASAPSISPEEEAHNLGREAARRFILRQSWPDSVELQDSVKSARNIKLRNDWSQDKAASSSFDSAFISTIRTIKPELAKKISLK